MKVAIMQPYFFPYGGYFQLMSSVDLFIYFDDVQFVRRGWMTRNKISSPSGDGQIYINVPVCKSDRSAKINEISIFGDWVGKHLKTFEHIYGKSVKDHIFYDFYSSLGSEKNLNRMLVRSLDWVSNYFRIGCKNVLSSELECDGKGQERIINLCKKVRAKEYWNLPGGVELYNRDVFLDNGLELNFIDTSHQKKSSIIETIFNEKTGNIRF